MGERGQIKLGDSLVLVVVLAAAIVGIAFLAESMIRANQLLAPEKE